MAEPQKPIIRPPKGRNPEHKIVDKQTNDTSRGSGENNSLMREISIRNNKQMSSESATANSMNMPQLKQVNKQPPKGLQRDSSKETLIVSARDGVSPNKESLNSIPSQQNLHSHRQANPIYKSHG